ncbi:hypothetical protein [Portibacter marinus]|uniref:hypothetical protein n=1 Tax=Portibacter marinus TaxID=2898660 RepID=UPI001F31A462|nr:hypothetical protein [Portibacter marinus]
MNKSIKLLYLLGHSRSGSTVISMHLGLQPAIFYAGEIKKFNLSFHERTCTCGKAAIDCPFWGQIISDHSAYFAEPIEKDIGIQLFYKNIKPFFSRPTSIKKEEESIFLKDLYAIALKNFPQTEFILDSSKSLSRLHLYRSMPNIQVTTIYMERDLRANIASFVKRGKGVLSSYLRLKINKWVMFQYLKRHKIQFLSISLEEFLEHPQGTLTSILEFVGVAESKSELKQTDQLHLISGNRKTRFGSTSSNFKVNKKVNEQDPFTNRQKIILGWLGL